MSLSKPRRTASPALRHVFVTGTDTDVGKTVFTAAFLAWLRRHEIPSIGFKPLASGSREDAERLYEAQQRQVPIDIINPWHFAEPIAPLLAARQEGRRVTLEALAGHVEAASQGLQFSVIEGAGGLLSPLMEGTDAPQVIDRLDAAPVVVAVDRIGVVGQVRLVWAALSPAVRARAQVVLMEAPGPDASTASNRALLGEYIEPQRIHAFPRLRSGELRKFGGTRTEEACGGIARGLGAGTFS